MKIKALLTTLAIVAALGLAACGGGGGDAATVTDTDGGTGEATEPGRSGNAPAPSGDAVRSAKVEILDAGYDPDPVTVEVGGKVTWINRDSAANSATAEDDSFDTGPLEEGKLKSETFAEAGTYEYGSANDQELHGTVIVVEPR